MQAKKISRLIIAGAILISLISLVFSLPGGRLGRNGMLGIGPGIERILDHIPDLTADQENQIYAILDPVRRELRISRRENLELRSEIHDLTIAGADEAVVNAKIDELTSNLAVIMKKGVTLRRQIFQLLTDEQREFIKEKRPKSPRSKLKKKTNEINE